MRLLIDNALSPVVATRLGEAGHDVVHVRELGLGNAPDDVIFDVASDQSRVLVSADHREQTGEPKTKTELLDSVTVRSPAQRFSGAARMGSMFQPLTTRPL